MVGQQRNIVPSLLQTGDGNFNDVDPVIEVLPEGFVLNHLPKISVGRGDQTEIYLDVLVPANVTETVGL